MALIAAICCCWVVAAPAIAVEYKVDDFGDGPPGVCLPEPNAAACSLREAITAARTAVVPPSEPIIKLLPGTYQLSRPGENGIDNNTSGDLDWSEAVFPAGLRDLQIQGAGSGLTTIDATALGERILEITATDTSVAVSGVTFKGGRASPVHDGADGGAIRAVMTSGPLFLYDVRFVDNTTSFSSGDGGAIAAEKNVTVSDSSFVNNTSGDYGGAISMSTPFQGGGSLTVSNSTFERNKALGVATPEGGGGAIANRGDSLSDELDVVATITNSTFDGNTALGFGGAIDTFGGGTTATNLESVTMTRNQANANANSFGGGGAIQNGGAAYTIKNSLIAGNTVGTGGSSPDCNGFFGSAGGNVTGAETGCNTFNSAGDIQTANPLIGALSANGGLTLTAPLLLGSPALDHTANCPAIDQRGVARPQGAACDSGAFEVAVSVPPPTSPPATGPTGQRAAALKKCKKKKSKKARKKCKKKAKKLPL